EQFNPRMLGLFINPFFLARRSLWKAVSCFGPRLQGPLLDVGCGSKPYRALFQVERYVGLDIDSETARKRGVADAFYDGTQFPFPDSAFASVLCNQVLEHVFKPEEFVQEIWRVLEPGGRLLLTVPFVWDEHEQPYDYARYSSFGLRALLQRNGFEVLEQRKLLSDFSMLVQLTIAYFYKVTRSRIVVLNLLVTLVFFTPLTLVGMLLGVLLPKNPDLFLDQLVLAEKPNGPIQG
ncbi:MAG: methyltransferase domain-containing protein, partial [Burkholderiaceae bacterium]